jgi:uncharacterized membrane protein
VRRKPLPPHLLLGIGVTAIHSAALGLGMHLVELPTGALLAFFVPGSVIVYLRRNRLLSATSSMERAALSVVLSLAYVGLAAVFLDFLTPSGITHPALLASIWLILMLGVGVEVYGQGADALASRRRKSDRHDR